LDGALFVSPVDMYYYAGTRQNGLLWIPTKGAPLLLVRKSFTRALTESLVVDTKPFPSSKEFPALFDSSISTIGLTLTSCLCNIINTMPDCFPVASFWISRQSIVKSGQLNLYGAGAHA